MTNRKMHKSLVAFFVGFSFALALGLSGMTQPQNIIQFLDFSNWNPALLFVMAGAVSVHAITYPLIRKRKTPLLDTQWHIPQRKDLTSRLVIGSALFGVGWGMGGFCPGPGVVSLMSGDPRALIFVVTMLLGMFVFARTEKFLPLKN